MSTLDEISVNHSLRIFREKHNLHVTIHILCDDKYFYKIYNTKTGNLLKSQQKEVPHDECMEKALKVCDKIVKLKSKHNGK